jgi:osmotically inducible protein OsmC
MIRASGFDPAPKRTSFDYIWVYFGVELKQYISNHARGFLSEQICRKLNLVEKGSPHNTDHYIMKRTASAVWQGDLKKGQGVLSTQSGVLNKTQYSFATRFENGIGTNPEELIAAAHAGCFTMALSAFLGNAGFTPGELSTGATLTLEQVEGNWTITAIHLDLSGRVPGIDAAKFDEIADQAKAGCPVSRVLKADITLTKKLVT